MIVYSDRSRIEATEKCLRKRYWGYHFDGLGLEGGDELKLDARIGTWVHTGIEWWLGNPTPDYAVQMAEAAGHNCLSQCQEVVNWDDLNDEQKFAINEGGQLVQALVYAWCRVRGQAMLDTYDVLAIEQEMTRDFAVGEDTVRFMARPDIVVRRKGDGAIFIRNLKTVRDPSTTWREQWALDMQTLSEPVAVDQWLFDGTHEGSCEGVTIDGLITGAVLEYPYGSGHRYHNTPLLYAWCKKGVANDPPFEVPDQWYSRYEWSCDAPHRMANGTKCPGGKNHRLSGVTKESIAERYKGGIIAWIDYLLENDRFLVEEQLIELPPILRAPYQIERWKRQVLARELDLLKGASWVTLTELGPDIALDHAFPMSTASGNCLRPGKCTFYDLCHGAAATDPYASGFRRRVPNHKQEGTNHDVQKEDAINTSGGSRALRAGGQAES